MDGLLHTTDIARQTQLRRLAYSEGYVLQKSRTRERRAPDYGLWRIVDGHANHVVAGGNPWDYSMTLDDVEAFLTGKEA